MRILILLLSLALFTSCSKDSPLSNSLPGSNDKDPGVEPISALAFKVVGDYSGNTWRSEWTQFIFNSLDEQSSGLLENEINLADLSVINCLKFNSLSRNEKKMFWALFMSSISHFESSFNPNERYWERSMRKYSEGLFQLSTSDSNYYSYCNVDSSNILDPEENISCAVSILDIQIEGSSRREPGRLFPTSYFYWSVLTRDTTRVKVQKFFKERVSEHLPFCS
ncbi:transglycosylase SLT domain-containing protein [Halobacteriovorax sp. JY17]|uniref:transglycosylase SLT domain-containing protein n=1 Tax=Halobacteriovorax sp. JY17 TaxID=2014617 RepID=UPI000C4FDF80|nr:transglycosylase SLT domain-containing protein [Halobacteriovorax sp. JY17]PIK14764.1 MAG: hypothetical protein CES88_10525 [Halobacteriovorax sp. JY17]